MKRLFPAIALLLLISGCAARNKTVTNLPTNVTLAQVQNWDTAVADLDRFSTAITTARQTVISLNKQGVFPDGPQYIATLNGLGRADQLEVEAATFLKGVPNDWSQSTQSEFSAYVTQISAALSDIVKQGTVGIKNPTSQQQVVALISNAAAIIGIVLSLS